jgi:hypothetical protein
MALPGGMQRYPVQLQVRQSDPGCFGAHEQHQSLDGSYRFTLLRFYSPAPSSRMCDIKHNCSCLDSVNRFEFHGYVQVPLMIDDRADDLGGKDLIGSSAKAPLILSIFSARMKSDLFSMALHVAIVVSRQGWFQPGITKRSHCQPASPVSAYA